MQCSQVAWAAAADALNDRTKYKSFFRTVPQYDYIPDALAEICQRFGWTSLAVVTQNENLFTTVIKKLIQLVVLAINI